MERKILKFLGQGPARVSPLARAGQVLLARADDRRLAVEQAAIVELARRGLVEKCDGGLLLTASGQAALARLEPGQGPLDALRREIVATELCDGDETFIAAVNANESPLSSLARRKNRNGDAFLSQGEFLAGERLRDDYTRGQIMPRVTASWDMSPRQNRRDAARGGHDLTDAALSARRRVDAALAEVGPEMASVLVDVCCFLKGLETIEAERGWPVRSAKLALKFALAALGRHYSPPARPRRSLHWGVEGYRPVSAFGPVAPAPSGRHA